MGEGWSIPPLRREEKGSKRAKSTRNPAGSTILGESLGIRGQAPSKAPRVPGVRMGGGFRLHTLPPMLQSLDACGWCGFFLLCLYEIFLDLAPKKLMKAKQLLKLQHSLIPSPDSFLAIPLTWIYFIWGLLQTHASLRTFILCASPCHTSVASLYLVKTKLPFSNLL